MGCLVVAQAALVHDQRGFFEVTMPAECVNETEDVRTCRRSLVACGVLIWLLCLAVLLLSHRFTEQIPIVERPLLLVLSLLAVMFGVYLWALRCVIRSAEAHVRWVIGFGILFRVTLLASEPIQEVDIYRYIWDGNVAARGS